MTKTIHLPILSMTFLLGACQTLPPTPHLPHSIALSKQARQTQQNPTVGRAFDKFHRPNLPSHFSGYYPLATGADAFATRSILTDMAQHTIDVQYYIWHDDEAGLLMLNDLWQAAERGVLVRLLLDDFNGSAKLDEQLLLFAHHPNIAVRVVNPFTYRRYKFINYLTAPRRINVRMHNKSMTFDNQLSIIGGRNIGNEYLNNHQNNHFADLDVLLIGQVVGDINQSFEDYWDSPTAYDIESLIKHNEIAPNQKLLSVLSADDDAKQLASHDERMLRRYRQAVADSTIGQDILHGTLPFLWAEMKFLADDVVKLDTTNRRANPKDGHLVSKLRHELGRPAKRLSIISSYFVPTKDGVETLTALAKDGVKISILTNSFDATDVGAVHAGYGHWRRELLGAGIRIYELKSTATHASMDDNRLWRQKHTTTTSLHAKAFAVDDDKVFIGSYNIDPRSANINTELGVMIYDNTLAERLHFALNNTNTDNRQILNQVYELHLVNQQLQWHTLEHGEYLILHQEPNMRLPERIGVDVLSLLPIDGWL